MTISSVSIAMINPLILCCRMDVSLRYASYQRIICCTIIVHVRFLVHSSGFRSNLAVTIQWKWSTYDFNFELIEKIIILFSILKYVTDYLYSEFFPGMYVLKDTKFLYYKPLDMKY